MMSAPRQEEKEGNSEASQVMGQAVPKGEVVGLVHGLHRVAENHAGDGDKPDDIKGDDAFPVAFAGSAFTR